MTDHPTTSASLEEVSTRKEERRRRTLRRIAGSVAVNAAALGTIWLSYHSVSLHKLLSVQIRILPTSGGVTLGFLLLFIPSVLMAFIWFPKARDLSWQKGGDKWPRVLLALVVILQTTLTVACALLIHLYYYNLKGADAIFVS